MHLHNFDAIYTCTNTSTITNNKNKKNNYIFSINPIGSGWEIGGNFGVCAVEAVEKSASLGMSSRESAAHGGILAVSMV